MAFLFVGCAQQIHSDVSPASSVKQSQILILGTAHLSNLDNFSGDMVDPILDILAEYNPDLIAIESSAPASVQTMLARPRFHEEALGSYAKIHTQTGDLAQTKLSLKWPEAIASLNGNNNSCGKRSATEDCILHAIASYEFFTGYLWWEYLSDPQKSDFLNKHPVIGARLQKMETSHNEYVTVATALAKRLSHDRLYQVDDHLEKGPTNESLDRVGNGFTPIQEFWNRNGLTPSANGLKNRQMRSRATQPNGMLPYYTWLNSDAYMTYDYNSQFAPMDRGEVDQSGHVFRAFFEARNLRMAGRITDVLAANPDKKMIVIVGASHKKFLDGYFDTMQWVTVVQFNELVEERTEK